LVRGLRWQRAGGENHDDMRTHDVMIALILGGGQEDSWDTRIFHMKVNRAPMNILQEVKHVSSRDTSLVEDVSDSLARPTLSE
jgi:hypothetical protein